MILELGIPVEKSTPEKTRRRTHSYLDSWSMSIPHGRNPAVRHRHWFGQKAKIFGRGNRPLSEMPPHIA
jgi:hypothetical protein